MQMIFENILSSDNMMPLNNIVSSQEAANLQDVLNAQNNSVMSELKNVMPQQSVPQAQNNVSSQGMCAPQNNMRRQNMMPSRNMQAATSKSCNNTDKKQASQQLAQACFAVHEAVLYLDTHPNDQNALEYYRRKQQQLFQASENYQKMVGPVRACSVDTSSGSWQWVETPWPWQIEED